MFLASLVFKRKTGSFNERQTAQYETRLTHIQCGAVWRTMPTRASCGRTQRWVRVYGTFARMRSNRYRARGHDMGLESAIFTADSGLIDVASETARLPQTTEHDRAVTVFCCAKVGLVVQSAAYRPFKAEPRVRFPPGLLIIRSRSSAGEHLHDEQEAVGSNPTVAIGKQETWKLCNERRKNAV